MGRRRRRRVPRVMRGGRICSTMACVLAPFCTCHAQSNASNSGAPHDGSVADADSGQCITHHEELSTACAWTFDGMQLLSISDAGVTCSRRAPTSAAAAASGSARDDDDDDTLDGDMWLDAAIALPPGCGEAQCVACARCTALAAVGTSAGIVYCVSLGARLVRVVLRGGGGEEGCYTLKFCSEYRPANAYTSASSHSALQRRRPRVVPRAGVARGH